MSSVGKNHRLLKVSLLVVISTSLLFAYNNCSPGKVTVTKLNLDSTPEELGEVIPNSVSENSSEEETNAALPGGIPTEPVNPIIDDPVIAPLQPTNTEELIAVCSQAASQGKLIQQEVTFTFSDPGEQCNWEADGNYSESEGSIRARRNQTTTFKFDDNASRAICNIELNHQPVDGVNFTYDDNLFLVLNSKLLAATYDYSSAFNYDTGLFHYNWYDLRGKDAENGNGNSTVEDQYCLGNSNGGESCYFPPSGSSDPLQMRFSAAQIQRIVGSTNMNSAELKLVSVGDNDNSDCRHSPLQFRARISYLQQ